MRAEACLKRAWPVERTVLQNLRHLTSKETWYCSCSDWMMSAAMHSYAKADADLLQRSFRPASLHTSFITAVAQMGRILLVIAWLNTFTLISLAVAGSNLSLQLVTLLTPRPACTAYTPASRQHKAC